MCRSMVDIQSMTAEIRRGKNQEERRKKQDKNIMSASATQGGHKQLTVRTAHMCVDITVHYCSVTNHNTAQSSSNNLPFYPPDRKGECC